MFLICLGIFAAVSHATTAQSEAEKLTLLQNDFAELKLSQKAIEQHLSDVKERILNNNAASPTFSLDLQKAYNTLRDLEAEHALKPSDMTAVQIDQAKMKFELEEYRFEHEKSAFMNLLRQQDLARQQHRLNNTHLANMSNHLSLQRQALQLAKKEDKQKKQAKEKILQAQLAEEDQTSILVAEQRKKDKNLTVNYLSRSLLLVHKLSAFEKLYAPAKASNRVTAVSVNHDVASKKQPLAKIAATPKVTPNQKKPKPIEVITNKRQAKRRYKKLLASTKGGFKGAPSLYLHQGSSNLYPFDLLARGNKQYYGFFKLKEGQLLLRIKNDYWEADMPEASINQRYILWADMKASEPKLILLPMEVIR